MLCVLFFVLATKARLSVITVADECGRLAGNRGIAIEVVELMLSSISG